MLYLRAFSYPVALPLKFCICKSDMLPSDENLPPPDDEEASYFPGRSANRPSAGKNHKRSQ